MWREMEDFPREVPGAYVVWTPKERWGTHYGLVIVSKISNGFLLTMDGCFEWDWDDKNLPTKWQPAPVAPNEQ